MEQNKQVDVRQRSLRRGRREHLPVVGGGGVRCRGRKTARAGNSLCFLKPPDQGSPTCGASLGDAHSAVECGGAEGASRNPGGAVPTSTHVTGVERIRTWCEITEAHRGRESSALLHVLSGPREAGLGCCFPVTAGTHRRGRGRVQ